MLGGPESNTGKALVRIRGLDDSARKPIAVDPALIREIVNSVQIDEEPKRNEDEIDLDESDSDSDEAPTHIPNIKDHLQSLLNKMDGGDAEPAAQQVSDDGSQSEPEFEKISSDEDSEDETTLDFDSALAPPPPPMLIGANDNTFKHRAKNNKPIEIIFWISELIDFTIFF